jgi:hypothetical protein
MSTIITGHFLQPDELHAAVLQLGHNGFAPSDLATYHRQAHATNQTDPAAEAYTATVRCGMCGVLLAVNVDHPGAEATAVAILGRCGAQRIDRAHGGWSAGHWCEFDHCAPIDNLLDQEDWGSSH